MIHLGTPDHLSQPKTLTFVYVVCYHELGGDPIMVSFLSTQVSAIDEHDAYDKGFAWLEVSYDIKSMTLVNDYVHQITGV